MKFAIQMYFFTYTRVRAFYLIRFRLVSLSFARLSRWFQTQCAIPALRSRMPPPIPFVYSLVFCGYANDSLCAETFRRSRLPRILHVSLVNYILNITMEKNFISFFISQYVSINASWLWNSNIDTITLRKCDNIEIKKKNAWQKFLVKRNRPKLFAPSKNEEIWLKRNKLQNPEEDLAPCIKEKKKIKSLLTDTRGLWRINHFDFLLSLAISPRFKHSADASACPLLSAIRYVHDRVPLSTTTHRRFCDDIRFPNISLLLPAPHEPLRAPLYGILPHRCIRYVQKCLASA